MRLLPVGSTHLGVSRAGSARPVLGDRSTQEEQVEQPQNRRIESRLRVLQRHGSEEGVQVLESVEPIPPCSGPSGRLGAAEASDRADVADPSPSEFLRE